MPVAAVLVMMKNCWLSLGVSSAALFPLQTAMAKRTERRWMEWMDWTGWRGLSGRSDGDWALQKRMQLDQTLKSREDPPMEKGWTRPQNHGVSH